MKELLLPIAANLVLGVILLTLLLWKSRPDTARLPSDLHALSEFQRHFPEATGTAKMSADGLGALIETATGTGLLLRHGRRWNARMIAPQELTGLRTPDESTIELRFADFGWPRARLRFSDRDTMNRCRAQLEVLVRSAAAPAKDFRHA